MITFTRVPTVAPGDPIVSTQFSKLAAAYNDRLRSGVADGPWRILFYWLSIFRQVRNSDESGLLFPALAEFFTAGYQMLEPADGEWPVTGPGEPEGANLACQMMAYVFGQAAAEVYPEDQRLTEPGVDGIPGGIPLWGDAGVPDTDAAWWALAKTQRGAFDPATGAMGSPAWKAARSHYRLAMSPRSPHGHAYGGYLPTPDLAYDNCLDPNPDDDFPPPTNYAVFFSRLTPTLTGSIEAGKVYGVSGGLVTYNGVVHAADTVFTGVVGVADFTGPGVVHEQRHYAGTCQPAPGNAYANHVRWISYAPWAYYVFLNDGTVDILATAEWLEGPYSGEAALRKTANGGLNRALNTFGREFRGSDSQRQESSYWLQEAFDMQRFLTSQYHLAPNIGTEAAGAVASQYPLFRLTGATDLALGTLAIHTQSGTDAHSYHADCLLTGCLVVATKLIGSATVELLNGTTVIQSVTLTADVSGNASALVFLSTPVRPVPLKVRLATAAAFVDATGKIEVECTEMMERKPDYEDLFLVLRCGGAITSEVMDGRGIDEDRAREIGENYFTGGCITALRGADKLPGQVDAVNSNAVFDAARRLSQCIRVVPRENLVGYAVQGGKSICWFTRGALIGVHTVDLFKGIAPARDAVTSGTLLPARAYVVRSGSVTYREMTYTAGQVFTAVAGFAVFTGTGAVYEHDGIRATAEPQGVTNEWLMGVQLKAYHPSDSSLWKADAYSDYFPLVNRCHFYSPEIANNAPLLWHTAYGNRVAGTFGGVLSPESPSALHYAPISPQWEHKSNVNKIDCGDEDTTCQEFRRNFYRSCRIFEPDPEIESVVVEMDGATELLKVTFKSRFHHAASAPASFSRDVGTWDITALRTEAQTIRTTENAIREYLVHQYDGTNATNTGPGNNAANSTVQSNPDNPYGSVYPHFYFVQLIPSPHEDGNEEQDPSDTPVTHDAFTQMELYLRAMCEGYVDGQTSQEYACLHDTTTLFDFSFESLCFQATGNRWFTLLPTSVRPDNAQGFGPLPNTEIMADTYHQFANALNLLTRVRIMLPMKLEAWYRNATAVRYVETTNADGTPNSFCSDGVCKVYWDGTPTDAAVVWADELWVEVDAITSYVHSVIDSNCDVDGKWGITTSRQSARIRYSVTDPDAMLAIPEALQDMLVSNPAVLAKVDTIHTVLGRNLTELASSAHCCLSDSEPCPGWWNHGDDLFWAFPPTADSGTTHTCQIIPALLESPALGASTHARGKTPSMDHEACLPGPENYSGMTPIVDYGALIEIPLV